MCGSFPVCAEFEKKNAPFFFSSRAHALPVSYVSVCALLCCAPPNQAAILLSFVSKIRSIWVVVCERLSDCLWSTLALESLLDQEWRRFSFLKVFLGFLKVFLLFSCCFPKMQN